MVAIAAAALGMRWPVLIIIWIALAGAFLIDAAWRLSPGRTILVVSLLGLVVGFCVPMLFGISSRYRWPFNNSVPNRAQQRTRGAASASGTIDGCSSGPGCGTSSGKP
jgi:hypothetical protein